jgi:hypothetical protein
VRLTTLTLLLGALVGVSASTAAAPPQRVPPLRPLADAPADPRDIDLALLVPPSGRLDHVWYVPRGRSVSEVVVGWSYRGDAVRSAPVPTRRWALTVWRPDRFAAASARWTPQTIVHDSPFSLLSTSVRLADVTHDGHADLLVTIECDSCNHAVAVASVWADVRGRMRHIYGKGSLAGDKDGRLRVHGRPIAETAWGAWHGLVWFDEPRGGTSVCCPAYRLQTFLRWDGRRWHVVERRRVSSGGDGFLGQRPVPAP